jgi:feruloyl esterase
LVDALDRWVETGDTPERIVATQHDPASVFMSSPDATVVRTRPLCAWPKQARYQGEGSTDDAASFTCE